MLTDYSEDTVKQFAVPSTIKLSVQDLTDILITALEGGIDYWCRKVGQVQRGDSLVVIRRDDEVWNEYICRNVAMGGTLIFFAYEEETGYTLTREKLLEAIAKVAVTHKLDLVDLGIDATDADVIVQTALFGKVVYG